MRTARALTVSHSILAGGVSARGGGGVFAPGGGLLKGGVVCSGGCLLLGVGVCSRGVVSALGGWCLLLGGGVCSRGGEVHPLLIESQMPVKT